MFRRITPSQLRFGVFIQELGGSWMSHPFWRSKILLTDEKTLAKVMESGIPDLVIDTECGLDVPDESVDARDVQPAAAAESVVQPPTPTGVVLTAAGPDYQEAAALCERSMAVVHPLFHQARMGQAIDAEH